MRIGIYSRRNRGIGRAGQVLHGHSGIVIIIGILLIMIDRIRNIGARYPVSRQRNIVSRFPNAICVQGLPVIPAAKGIPRARRRGKGKVSVEYRLRGSDRRGANSRIVSNGVGVCLPPCRNGNIVIKIPCAALFHKRGADIPAEEGITRARRRQQSILGIVGVILLRARNGTAVGVICGFIFVHRPIGSQRNVVGGLPNASCILNLTAVPTVKGIAVSRRLRQNDVGIKCGIDRRGRYRPAVCIQRYGIGIGLPVGGVCFVARSSNGNGDLFSRHGLSFIRPARKSVTRAGRIRQGERIVMRIFRRIARSVDAAAHRVGNGIYDGIPMRGQRHVRNKLARAACNFCPAVIPTGERVAHPCRLRQ